MVLEVVSFCPIGRSSVGNHWNTFVLIYYHFCINLYTVRYSLRLDFGGREDIRETATTSSEYRNGHKRGFSAF